MFVRWSWIFYLIFVFSVISKTVSINGAAAHKASPNDIIIICAYGLYEESEAKTHEPTLVYFDKDNNIKSIKHGIPEQKL